MKKLIFFPIIALLLMALISCEKENDSLLMNKANITEDIYIPTEVANYLTPSEISEFNQEVEIAIEDTPPHYRIETVAIIMNNEIEYLHTKSLPPPTQIKFTGKGKWEDFGIIRYDEIMNMTNKTVSPKGEGTIFLNKKTQSDNIGPVTENRLEFVCSLRKEIKYESGYSEKDIDPAPVNKDKKFSTRLDFKGGDGMFEGSYGIAKKIEVHYLDRPNYCKSAIYGYVFIKE